MAFASCAKIEVATRAFNHDFIFQVKTKSKTKKKSQED
jgi:hypothetical protein